MLESMNAMPASEAADDRLFSGIYPCGIVYADRYREEGGDYVKLAFLPYDTLVLQINKNCPPALKSLIEANAAKIQAQRGQQFTISTAGQTVRLGPAEPAGDRGSKCGTAH